MLELTFSPDDVARIRFAFSPLWETVVSLRALRAPADRALHLPWIRRARAALAERPDLDLALLYELVPVARGYIPDFLTPPPTTPVPDLAAEIAAMRATSLAQVRHDLERMPGPPGARLAEVYQDPAAGLAHLADTLAAYWRATMAPDWPRVRGLLEGEVSYRARRLAEGGAHLLFRDLHERVTWDTDRLSIQHRHWHSARVLDGRGLVLVPSVFAWPAVYSITEPPWQPTLLYPPRGIATLWDTGAATGPVGLAAVIGTARATLLAQLDVPASTTELSRRTGLTPGGVSQHLSALRGAGLVVSHRAGRSVLHTRTPTADALLSASRP